MPETPQRTRMPRLLACFAIASALALGAGIAAPPPPASALSGPVEWDGMRFDSGGAAIVNGLVHRQLSPGLDQIEYERIGAEGRQQLHILRVALADSNLYVDYVGNDKVTVPGTVTEFVDGAGAIAGVNGDFFDINNSSAPLGVAISRDRGILKSADRTREAAATFTESGLGRVASVFVEGTIVVPDGTLPLYGINTLGAATDSVTVYNAHWGAMTRTRSIPAGMSGVEVLVGADGTVTRVAGDPGAGQLADGENALVAIDGGSIATRLRALRLGDKVSVEYRLNQDNADVRAAVSGHPTSEPPMLEDGVIGEATSPYMRERHPRTGVGFTADGRTAYFVVADGRQSNAAGMTLPELAQLMLDLGARTAINLDGGGSSQLNSRQPGDDLTTVRNSPSDGYERRDANGLGIFLRTPGSGALGAYDVRTRLRSDDAVRVFPGLTRQLTALGYDETGSAVHGTNPTWSADGAGATVSAGEPGTGTVTGVAPGGASVVAADGTADGRLSIDVLGPLERVTASTRLLAFGDTSKPRTLSIIGHDANGFQAPIEPDDVEIVGAPEDLLSFAPSADGTFAVTALRARGSATVTFRVTGHEVRVPITVGLDEVVFADFANADRWISANDRAPGGSVAPAEGHDGAPGLRLAYNFTQSTATRGQYAVAPDGGIMLPGQPQKVTAWIHGDGNGAWPRLQVRQANGTTSNLDGPMITWTGWQKAEFAVPAGVSYPLRFQRVRIMETRAAASYAGEVRVSGLAAALAPEVDMPTTNVVEDPVVVPAGATAGAPLRVAVMSDAQFVARNPDSEMVVGARRALREIVAARPDLLVINGDFVDEASPADFALAKTILDEELAGVSFPWHYSPGNHEIMGGAIANFEAAFGSGYRTFDQDGTRFVLLDTSTGALSGKYDQIRMLHDALASAETDPTVTGVVVMEHHPLDDPLPTKASQLSNRLDASMLRDWFEQFRANSGKSIGFVGSHVGVFHAMREDGVPYLVNGNSGKAPAGSEFGDFTGWTMLGIDPAQGRWQSAASPWLSSEVKVRVDALRLGSGDRSLVAGERVDLDPVIDQPGRTDLAVKWPMSSAWSGAGLFVGAPADAPRGTIAAVDPATHVFTALRSGSVAATLTVNGVSQSFTLGVRGGEVSIIGDAVQGQTLHADLGDWSLPSGALVGYEWLRDGEAVAGANGTTYAVAAADAGARISLRVTVTLPGGAPVVFTSDATSAVPHLELVPVTPLVAGTAQVGSALTAVPGTWRPEQVALAYQWSVAGVEVAGATGSTFTPSAAHEGSAVTVTVTGAAPGYATQSRTSAPVGPVAAAPASGHPVQTLEVSPGTVEQGGRLTVTGRGFAAGANVDVWLHSEPVLLGVATAATDGSLSLVVAVPRDAAPGAHAVVATDPRTGVSSSAALAIVAVGQLPRTGSEFPAGLVAGIGFGVLALGAIAGVWAIRRRSASAE